MSRKRCSGAAALVAAVALVVLGSSASVEAQAAWDVAAFGGLLAAHSPVPENVHSYDDWLHVGQFGVSVSRHVTRHLKAEAEATVSGTGRQFVQRFTTVPGFNAPYPISAEAETSFRSVSATALWQFFDNEWVHPFVVAGVNADFQRRSVHTPQQYFYRGDPRVTGNEVIVAREHREGPERSLNMQALIGGGVKLYVAERAFIRAEARTALGAKTHSVALRAGVGIDW